MKHLWIWLHMHTYIIHAKCVVTTYSQTASDLTIHIVTEVFVCVLTTYSQTTSLIWQYILLQWFLYQLLLTRRRPLWSDNTYCYSGFCLCSNYLLADDLSDLTIHIGTVVFVSVTTYSQSASLTFTIYIVTVVFVCVVSTYLQTASLIWQYILLQWFLFVQLLLTSKTASLIWQYIYCKRGFCLCRNQ